MPENRLFTIYIIVWSILAIGSLLFMANSNPEFKKKWYPRISILNLIIIGAFLESFLWRIKNIPSLFDGQLAKSVS